MRRADVPDHHQVVREDLQRDADEAQHHEHDAGHVRHDPVAAHRQGERTRRHRPYLLKIVRADLPGSAAAPPASAGRATCHAP